jgi:enterochelin esterase-like enzyme
VVTARAQGLWPATLDRLMAARVAPAIVVSVGRGDWGEDKPSREEEPAAAMKVLLEEAVPEIDRRYPTLAAPEGRAIIGHDWMGQQVFEAALREPPLFGAVGLQGLAILDTEEAAVKALVRTPAERPLRIYQDWGRYELHSSRENADMRVTNRRFNAFLRERGYRPAGGEAPDGGGWASYRNRTDKLFEALFPAR